MTDENHELPPHDITAEQGAIACILLDPRESIIQCEEKLKHGGEFYSLNHKAIFEAILALSQDGKPVDTITIAKRLTDTGNIGIAGGLSYLSEVADKSPSAANLPHYLDIIVEKFALRQLTKVCTETIQNVRQNPGDVWGIIDKAERDILAVSPRNQSDQEKTLRTFIDEFLVAMKRRQSGELFGLPTGFHELDKLTGGLEPGTMFVIGARPSVGKTALAMNIAENVLASGIAVGVFSLEMPGRSIAERMVSGIASVNTRATASWCQGDYERTSKAAARLNKLPLYVDDRPSLTIRDIKAKARRWKKNHNIGLLVVDYLQLVATEKGEKRFEAISAISCGLKAIAKELDIPAIVLAQLNRESEKESRRPRLSDLRESGQIEQDADIAAFLYRENDEHDPSEQRIAVNLFVAKQRNGPAGETVRLIFNKPFTRFESATPIQE